MSHHIAMTTLIALQSASALACDKPGVMEQQKETIANQEAKNAAHEAQRQAQGAQAAADKTVAAARADFEKAREDYLHARRLDLADLDRRIGDLEANAKMATGNSKRDAMAQFPNIRAQRDAYAHHLESLETATPAAWDGDVTSLGKEWDSLKAAVDTAG
jgi:phosphoenolpyruvate-protein kinase (PTS system EI component)